VAWEEGRRDHERVEGSVHKEGGCESVSGSHHYQSDCHRLYLFSWFFGEAAFSMNGLVGDQMRAGRDIAKQRETEGGQGRLMSA